MIRATSGKRLIEERVGTRRDAATASASLPPPPSIAMALTATPASASSQHQHHPSIGIIPAIIIINSSSSSILTIITITTSRSRSGVPGLSPSTCPGAPRSLSEMERSETPRSHVPGMWHGHRQEKGGF